MYPCSEEDNRVPKMTRNGYSRERFDRWYTPPLETTMYHVHSVLKSQCDRAHLIF